MVNRIVLSKDSLSQMRKKFGRVTLVKRGQDSEKVRPSFSISRTSGFSMARKA